MHIYEYSTGYGALTTAITDNGQTVVAVHASADVVHDYKAINGTGINRLLRFLAIKEYRRLYR